MKLAIGGAQFGMHYGVTNHAGQPEGIEVEKILDQAFLAGLNLIDTAPAYGTSEEKIGESLTATKFEIITKTLPMGQLGKENISLTQQFMTSLTALRRENIFGLLFHNAESLLGEDGQKLFDQARALRDLGLVRKIGVSVYTETQIQQVVDRFCVDIIQIPINVFDQRLLGSNILYNLFQSGIEIHARSVFLQGLLLATPTEVEKNFAPILPAIRKWRSKLKKLGLSPLSAALSFLKFNDNINRILIGVNSVAQLEEILAAYDSAVPLADPDQYSVSDDFLIDPRLWSQNTSAPTAN